MKTNLPGFCGAIVIMIALVFNFGMNNAASCQALQSYHKTIELSFQKSNDTLSFDFNSIPSGIVSNVSLMIYHGGAHGYNISQVVCGTQSVVCGTYQYQCGTYPCGTYCCHYTWYGSCDSWCTNYCPQYCTGYNYCQQNVYCNDTTYGNYKIGAQNKIFNFSTQEGTRYCNMNYSIPLTFFNKAFIDSLHGSSHFVVQANPSLEGMITSCLSNKITMELSFNYCMPSSSSIIAAGCDTYTAPDGQIYTTSGNKTAVIPNKAGCDSTISINLSIYPTLAAAGAISGLTTVCPGQNAVIYTVPSIEGATLYTWTLPNGLSGSSTTNSITVDCGLSATSGDITVTGSNPCGQGIASTLAITVNPLPEAAGNISGLTEVCQGENPVTYSVPQIANATSYAWTLPGGAAGTSTLNSIIVDFGLSAIPGNIMVNGTNSCGNGSVSTVAINVKNKPATPAISLSGNMLHSDALIDNQWFDQNGIINGAINKDYISTANGDYYAIVKSAGCVSEASNTISIVNTGVEIMANNKMVRIYPNPFSNELIIEIEGNKETVNFEILNAIGHTVFKGNLEEKTIIQTGHFASGVYLVKLENGNTFEFIKMVKE